MKRWIGLGVILLFAAGITGVWFLYRQRQKLYPSTDDAYVSGDVYQVASRIPGTVIGLPVEENRWVEAGSVIAILDPRDMDTEVRRAEAALAAARSVIATRQAAVARARAGVEEAAGELELRRADLRRFKALVERSSVPRRAFDQVVAAEKVARARHQAALKALAGARAALKTARRAVHEAEVALAMARLKRSYCTVRTPIAGFVSKKTAHVGQVVAPGQPLCAVVPLAGRHLWIEANFKETQLARIRPGQPVRFHTDVDPGREYRGVVESLSAGTGAAFSLLPPENATGNWVKIVQRLPVRIAVLPGSNRDHSLRLGLSVHVTVDTTGRSGAAGRPANGAGRGSDAG